MLARSFKVATELGLEEAHQGALIKVLGMLERGEISFARPGRSTDGPKSAPIGFNMHSFYAENECGTVGCIAAWAETVGNLRPYELRDAGRRNKALGELFEPYGVVRGDIRPCQAASGLFNYLSTGAANWRAVLNGV